MFVKEMGEKHPKGIKVGMTRTEADKLNDTLIYMRESMPKWSQEDLSLVDALCDSLTRVLKT